MSLPAEMPPMFPILPSLPDIVAETARRGGRRYGPRVNPITKQGEFHNGVDLACSKGTPIYCPWDGVVEFAKWAGNGGNQVNIVHANGLCTKYLHLDSFSVSVGRKLKAGDVFGHVGSTGMSTGPHLHFCVMGADRFSDPRRFVNPEAFYLDPLPFLSCTVDIVANAFLPGDEVP